MSVPEAAVYENGGAVFGKHQIGRTRQIPGVQSESETQSEKAFTNQHFRLGVFAADARHTKASLLRTQNVSHTAIVLPSGQSTLRSDWLWIILNCCEKMGLLKPYKYRALASSEQQYHRIGASHVAAAADRKSGAQPLSSS